MTELVDNLIQIVISVAGCIWSGVLFYTRKAKCFFLMACFYGTFFLGTMYWTLNLALFDETPQIFYVSELGWIASYIFLIAAVYAVMSDAERSFRTPLILALIAFCLPQFVFYVLQGELFSNVLMCGLTLNAGLLAVRGLAYAKKNSDTRGKRPFYIIVLCFVALEYLLWTLSCFWMGDTLANPYFWCDYLLSASMLAMLPAIEKAVKS